ncbi:MAG TPA: protoglobin domain-containing protein, partial [Azonexus sp.]|nr:protoglobin domain-containing protein [Azonexus sp.]
MAVARISVANVLKSVIFATNGDIVTLISRDDVGSVGCRACFFELGSRRRQLSAPGGNMENKEKLLPEMSIPSAEVSLRKAFLEFTDDDVAVLEGVNGIATHYADSVIDDFYKHLLSFEETRAFLADPAVLARVREMQKAYFTRLTQGNYDEAYVADRIKIGRIHERIGLPVKSYFGMYCFYLRAVLRRLRDEYVEMPERAFSAFDSLMKLTFFDIGLAIDTYIESREQTIQGQEEAIRELSTPVLLLRPGLLLLPIIGLIDTRRARQLTEQLLRSVRANRAMVVVIDVTGVPSVDTKVANHLVQTVEAAGLMGAVSIVTGIAPDIAQTMVRLGIDLRRIRTVGDLQSG